MRLSQGVPGLACGALAASLGGTRVSIQQSETVKAAVGRAVQTSGFAFTRTSGA
jgi:hypothetical protein